MNAVDTKPVGHDHAPVVDVLIPHRRVSLVPLREMTCLRCGTTYRPTENQHDRTALLAGCCPRCDGQLAPSEADHAST